jgi:hypothetical protein
MAAHNEFADCSEATFFDCVMFAAGLVTDGNTLVALIEEPVGEGHVALPWVSTDGINWEKAISTGETPLGLIAKVVPTNSGFVGVGTRWDTDGANSWQTFAVWESTDGHTWTDVPIPEPSNIEDIFLGPVTGWHGGIAAFGEISDLDWTTFTKVMWTSTDGIEWTRTH